MVGGRVFATRGTRIPASRGKLFGMTPTVDVWLRGTNSATTVPLQGALKEPHEWEDEDVRRVIEGMLQAMDRLQNPSADARPVSLRGISWIVNPYEGGGVVIAIEITLGAAIAGPFHVDEGSLNTMIARVLQQPMPPASTRVH